MKLFRSHSEKKAEKLVIKYTEQIFKCSVESTNSIIVLANDENGKEKLKIGDEVWFQILFEFIYLYLSHTDRFLFNQLTDKNRSKIMKIIVEASIYTSVDTVCKDWPSDMVKKIKQECMDNYFSFIQEYSQYKKFIEDKDESPKGTVLWEFGKNITKLAGHEMDILYMMPISEIIVTSLKDLDTKSFFPV